LSENSHHRKTSTLTPAPTRRPRSHPRYTLVCDEPHWIVGRGHESDAKTLKFLDPANELWKQYGTKASFSQSASSFHKYVTTNGIVG
jgi:hypothetical protein